MTTGTVAQKPMTDASTPGTVIAKSERTSSVIRTPDEYATSLSRWNREAYHVLSPFANFAALPGHFGIVPTLVALDDDPSPKGNGDVYQDNAFTKGNDVAISKIGLAKIAQAAGMSIITERTDPRTIANLWEVRATVKFVGLDGTVQVLTATEEHDLRDGSPRTKGFQPNQLNQARAKGLRGCEARAINAAIRLFGIKQKYTRDELKKPFVVVRIVHQPDMSDPAVRQQVTERALAGTNVLYGAAAALPAATTPEVIDTIGVDPLAAARNVTPATSAQAVDAPKLRTVLDVEFDGEAGLYEVTLDGGELLQTKAHDMGKRLSQAKKAGVRVALMLGPDGLITGVEERDQAPTPPAAGGAALPADALFVEKLESRTGTNARGPWVIVTATFSNGKVAATFLGTLQQQLAEAKDKRLPVRIATSEKDGFDDQLDSLSIIDSRQGRLL
jgi:hypothetical protein